MFFVVQALRKHILQRNQVQLTYQTSVILRSLTADTLNIGREVIVSLLVIFIEM